MFWHMHDHRDEPEAAPLLLQAPMAVALQGGGAHGAFTWGVLDRLLDEADQLPVALSGASAGAINAVVVASGLLNGGRDGARQALRELWTAIGRMSLMSPMGLPGAGLQFDLMTRMVSPYQFNPLNFNPLRDLLARMIDFERLRRDSRIRLFISATNVATGDQRVFRESEMSLDVLMASSCIPYAHQAVEIDGEPYWDGGFSSNPPILPMVLETDCRSLLLIKLTPDSEPGLLTAAPDIFARLKRILFNAPLLRELDALAEMQKLLGRTQLVPGDLRRLRDLSVEMVAIEPRFFSAASGSALNPRPDLLDNLHEAGREAAAVLFDRPAATAGRRRAE